MTKNEMVKNIEKVIDELFKKATEKNQDKLNDIILKLEKIQQEIKSL